MLRIAAVIFGIFAVSLGSASHSAAETLRNALAHAYNNNPTLNAQRAATRSIDNGVPLAKSGWLPQLFFDADVGYSYSRTRSPSPVGRQTTVTYLNPRGFGVTIQQTLWDSYRTLNTVEAASAAVRASREQLRNTEQNVLFDAATAFADVILTRRVVQLREESLTFLREQVRSEQARFDVGEGTRTDVAQAQATRDAAIGQLQAAIADREASEGVYRQIIGREPGRLRRPGPLRVSLPGHLGRAIDIARAEHPAIKATQHLVDQAAFNVKASESEALPSVTLEGNVRRRFDVGQDTDQDSASITARLRVPIYQGGRVAAQVRREKETLGQRRIEVDQSIDQVRAAVVSAYSQLQSSRAAITSNRSQIRAAQLALEGALEERAVGQRTTLDVLNTQQQVINARLSLAQAERNVEVAEYALLSALGRLSSRTLNLPVEHYDPVDHFIKVKDAWKGLRTPSGQ